MFVAQWRERQEETMTPAQLAPHTQPLVVPEAPLSLVAARADWSIDDDSFPTGGSPSAKLLFLLKYAVLAPSVHNTQPWRFEAGADYIDVLADRACALPELDPHGRERVMACGAALQNLWVASRYFGYAAQVEEFPDPARPDCVARLRLVPGRIPDVADRDLFRAITLTRDIEGPLDIARPSPHLLHVLEQTAARHGCSLLMFDRPALRAHLEDLIVDADHWLRCQPALAAERQAWTRHPGQACVDGIAPDAVCRSTRLPDLGAPVWSLEVGQNPAGEPHSLRLAELAQSAPVLVALLTRRDTMHDWLAAGRARQHLALAARHAGVWLSLLNQPVQVPQARRRLRNLTRMRGWPQAVARLGFGPEVAPTPRRSAKVTLTAA
jgi:hypothetical protein